VSRAVRPHPPSNAMPPPALRRSRHSQPRRRGRQLTCLLRQGTTDLDNAAHVHR
jgi:hypothetical protein